MNVAKLENTRWTFFDRLSVKSKLNLIVMLVSVTALVIAMTILYIYSSRWLEQKWLQEATVTAENIAYHVTAPISFDDHDAASETLGVLSDKSEILEARVIKKNGEALASYPDNDSKPIKQVMQKTFSQVIQDGIIETFSPVKLGGEQIGGVYLRTSLKPVETAQQSIMLLGLILSIAVTLISYLLSTHLQRLISGPLTNLSTIARKIKEEGDYSLRAEKMSDDEIGQLVNAFNGMLTEIESVQTDLVQEQKRVVRALKQTRKAKEEIESLNKDLELRVDQRTHELQAANAELEAFSYSVSHDLRAPLRAINGFAGALNEDFGEELTGDARAYLEQMNIASKKMADLIDGLLVLSRSTRGELRDDRVDLSQMFQHRLSELQEESPERAVEVSVEEGMLMQGDPRMMEVVVVNLLDNAWKYTGNTPQPHIEVFSRITNDSRHYCVKDNGAGFDMAYSSRLFKPFQRLHRQDEFPGIGIGLATVKRIIHRHGGEIDVSASLNEGACICFSLGQRSCQ